MYVNTRLYSLGFLLFALSSTLLEAVDPNQTTTLTAIQDSEDLPFDITIETADFALPAGIHSGVFATHGEKCLFLTGRTNGMHTFGADPFPPSKQNITAIVVDFENETTYTRDLDDSTSGLSQDMIDSLSVTSPQFYQNDKTLYISGGYGIDTETGVFGTKSTLTAIDVPEFIEWVIDPLTAKPALASIRQTTSDWLQVTGGYMANLDNHLNSQLIFGQNFTGVYTPGSNGVYTKQVRRFQIIDDGKELYVQVLKSEEPNASYRRRDLNVVPYINGNREEYVALSGVFTTETGIWTVPVEIDAFGKTFMADPTEEDTFKQGMNNYVSASVSLHSPKKKDNYFILLGGITFGYFDGGTFETNPGFPFTNQITTIKRDKKGEYSQFLMDEEYPVILSTGTNPGNQFLFGAGAFFISATDMPQYRNQVVNLDKLKSPVVLGYIVGGIMSTLPNTNTREDSSASPYIFKLTLTPKE